MTNWDRMAKASGREWYLAASLIALGNEINARWPNRDTSSDGAVGDTSHQARKSDHNPDYEADGVVRAIDVDKDGISMLELMDAVVRDPRVAYVIWNGRIASATDDGTPWNWEPYDGSNQHTGHAHISLKHTRAAENDTRLWFPPTPTPPKEDDMALSAEDKTFINKSNQVYANAVNTFVRQSLISLRQSLVASDIASDKAQADRVIAALDKEAAELSAKILADADDEAP